MSDKPNRRARRSEMFFVEKDLIALAQRVVKLDASIKRVEEQIEITSAENINEIRELNEKLFRLKVQADKVGEKYDMYVKQHQSMQSLGKGSSPSILSALEESTKPDADDNLITDKRSARAY